MKVLLVYPRYPDTFWSFRHVLKFVRKKALLPPLGILTVASMLPEKWEKRLVDANVTKLRDKDIEWADMVFISAMIVQQKDTQEVVRRSKEKGKIVVAGGPYFTTQHKNVKGVDHFVLNEAEVTLPLFLDDLKKGKAKHIYRSKERPDIKKTPVPMWSLIKHKHYSSMAVQYSRGCPFNCEFCDIIIMNGRKPRTKTADQMMREFIAIYKTGYRGPIFIVDDNFIGNKKEAKQLLPILIKWQKKHKFPFSFLTEASTNMADDQELMNLMRTANFNKVFLGIETPNVDSLKECGKHQNVSRDLSEAVQTITGNGIQVFGGFIVGFDNDTDKIFDSQIKFIQENGICAAMVGVLTVIPETPLWIRLEKENRLTYELITGENTDATLNYIPAMGKEELIEGYKTVLSTIYSPKEYYQRINTFLKFYKPSTKSKLKMNDIRAFIKTTWRIGLFSNSRFRYWKLIIKTGLTKRKAFPVAVEYAIYGEHFKRITKRIVRS
jgi:radical SAM superfamily enzyme YgiQ (UPF0313 family)